MASPFWGLYEDLPPPSVAASNGAAPVAASAPTPTNSSGAAADIAGILASQIMLYSYY